MGCFNFEGNFCGTGDKPGNAARIAGVNSFHVIAVLTAKEGKEQELLDALRGLAEASRLEPGCQHYVPYAADKGGRFYVDEIYDSAEAFDAHLASGHFKAAAESFPALLEGEVVIDFVKAI